MSSNLTLNSATLLETTTDLQTSPQPKAFAKPKVMGIFPAATTTTTKDARLESLAQKIKNRKVVSAEQVIAAQKAKQQDKAARVIQRAWRHSNAGPTFLKKHKDEISLMPHRQLKTLCSTMKPVLQRGSQNPARQQKVQHAIDQIREDRLIHQSDFCLPVCSSLGSERVLPEYELASEWEKPLLERLPHGSIYVTPETLAQLNSAPKSPPKTREDLDALVQEFHKQSNLFPWDYLDDGCYARAQVMIDFLTLCGVPQDKMAKQYVMIPKDYRAGFHGSHAPDQTWNYHVAPIITLPDGSRWVIDPSLSKDKAISLDEWISLQKRTDSSLPPMESENWGKLEVDPSDEDSFDFTYDPNKALIFHTNIDTSLFSISPDLRFLNMQPLDTTNRDKEMERLAEYREELEKSWLESVLV